MTYAARIYFSKDPATGAMTFLAAYVQPDTMAFPAAPSGPHNENSRSRSAEFPNALAAVEFIKSWAAIMGGPL